MKGLFQILPLLAFAPLQFLHPGVGRSLVQQIDGLIRQVQVRQIPDGQVHRRLQGLLRNTEPVMPLQAGLQALQNSQRRGLIRLLHPDRPEPPLQGRVLFNEFPVFLQGRGPQHLQFSPAQGGLQNVGSVDGSLRRPGSHDGVHFVHK